LEIYDTLCKLFAAAKCFLLVENPPHASCIVKDKEVGQYIACDAAKCNI
jgi:hypothetical protein